MVVAGGTSSCSPGVDERVPIVERSIRRECKSTSALGQMAMPVTSRAELVRQNSAALIHLDRRGMFDASMTPAELKSLRRQGSLGRLPTRATPMAARQASMILTKSSATNVPASEEVNRLLESDETEAAVSSLPGVKLFYASSWSPPFVHHSLAVDSPVWTPPPGVPMVKCDEKDLQKLGLVNHNIPIWKLELPNHESMEFVPNDCGRAWDNAPGKKNYFIRETGDYLLSKGQIVAVIDPPGTPAVPNILKISGDSATLAWSRPIESLAAGYVIYRDEEEVGRTNETTFCDVGLNALSTYRYSVAAFNKNQIVGMRTESIEARTAAPGRPSVVRNLNVAAHSRSSIELTFQPPSNNGGAPIAEFLILRNEKEHARHPSSGKDWERYIDTLEIVANEKYAYRIAAINRISPDGGAAEISAISEMSQSVEAIARTQLALPRIGDRRSHIILQGFNWRSAENKNGWWRVLGGKVEMMKECGISMVWLPPPSQSVSKQGYMPSKLYNLNSHYGTCDDLKSLISQLKEHDMHAMLDLVANHRCGTKQDKSGQWTVFEDPDWGSWAIVSNNKQGYAGSGAADTGAQSECAPDLDHTNNKVREDLKKWTKWLFDEIGFSALRIDMAPGYGSRYQIEYLENVGRPYAVGEYWSGDVNCLMNYVSSCHGRIGAFDFAFYYPLRRAVESGNYGELNVDGRLNGLVGRDPDRAVTFIDNHDTEHIKYVGLFAGGDRSKILRGYAVLLTAPGTPCVYWNHLSDCGEEVTTKIKELCNARITAKIHSKSGYYIDRADNSVFAAYVSRDGGCHRGGGNLAVCVGGRGWSPCGADWRKSSSGDGYCVWVR